jgi:exosome complex exonuclease DIS3/RRP44
MEYFIPHDTSCSRYLSGTLEIDNSYNPNVSAKVILDNGSPDIIIQTLPLLNRALHLDNVCISPLNDGNYYVCKIIQRHKIVLTGILDLSSNIKYGFNKKNVPYYLFKPTDFRYPSFYVASKNKSQKKVYALVEFTKWNITDKYPYGNCLEIMGNLGDINVEYQHILTLYHLQYPNLNHKYKQIEFNPEVDDRLDLRHLNVYSIDPPNCKDIDDAFHLTEIADDIYEIGIHIADVSHFIHFNDDLDKIIQSRLTSVYPPHKTINMLPNIYSDNICSLLPNKDRYAFSFVFQINNQGEIIEYRFVKTIIHSKKAFSYQEADNLIQKDEDCDGEGKGWWEKSDISKINRLTDLIYLNNNFQLQKGDSKSSFMIQILMVLANKYAAEHIYNNFPELSLLRTHLNLEKKDLSKQNELNQYLIGKNMKSALYQIAPAKTSHDTLNIQKYTHFTSPIRRYADIIVHRLLQLSISNQHCTWDTKDINNIVDNMNERNKTIRKAEQKMNRLIIIDKLNNNSIETTGYITEIFPEQKKIELYIPCYKLSIKTRIFHRKLDTILDYQFDSSEKVDIIENSKKNNDSDNKSENVVIIDKNKQETISLVRYQKITVSLTPYLKKDSFEDKLEINLVEPYLNIN